MMLLFQIPPQAHAFPQVPTQVHAFPNSPVCQRAIDKLAARIDLSRRELKTQLNWNKQRLPVYLKNSFLGVQKEVLEPLYTPVKDHCSRAASSKMKKNMAKFHTEVTKVR
ncbi:hypothetical protein, partial [Magnetococcus sp. PR-3]|uniref:hypothetical protein n=1 Tax=Magnetococcus sp. PR-3 TaxID=3120355 RepID=UPI002FCE11E2